MCEIIVVTSGKGGVGKTTTTANLGAGLAMMRKKVLMIDTDIGLRNLDVVMGLEHRILYNLVDIVEGNCRIRQAVIRDRQFPGLYLIPAAQTRDKSAVTPEQMIKVVNELRDDFDYILLDSPAGIEQGFRWRSPERTAPLWSRHRRFPLFGMRIASLDYCFPLRSMTLN